MLETPDWSESYETNQDVNVAPESTEGDDEESSEDVGEDDSD